MVLLGLDQELLSCFDVTQQVQKWVAVGLKQNTLGKFLKTVFSGQADHKESRRYEYVHPPCPIVHEWERLRDLGGGDCTEEEGIKYRFFVFFWTFLR